ncbi:hypothetical protein AVEN_241672-1 [Araneus ventricosus]|uniref:Uncharacterized protein n=1 Tax=Araneus ventricosus TaxID=182803 RepID=A0A4Y2IXC7_ARAVE|nr:hypothetical protein AVEN_241672-1 [Araneus ventricosus]
MLRTTLLRFNMLTLRTECKARGKNFNLNNTDTATTVESYPALPRPASIPEREQKPVDWTRGQLDEFNAIGRVEKNAVFPRIRP